MGMILLMLNFAQPSPSPAGKSSHDELSVTSAAINAASLEPDSEKEKPVYTIDGELIPPKPVFPDNCKTLIKSLLLHIARAILAYSIYNSMDLSSGCSHCVLDIYQEEMQEWNERVRSIRERLLKENKPLPAILEKADKSGGEEMDPGMKAFMELEKKLEKS
ncbi:16249_t:CDS:2 [Acaulospora morrowiae]|uniref:16249_t:CDS:1 n=1 Tax=Acaulospora morrowiae TaxID=94023 RepID=A0A9N8V5C7_9GLOM|nr:16249_t:CDS:2 [Acaulospora morrowiae]